MTPAQKMALLFAALAVSSGPYVAREAMKLVAPDLKKLNLIDDVIDEPTGGAHHHHQATADAFKATVLKHLEELKKLPVQKLLDQRYEKFRSFGEWQGK